MFLEMIPTVDRRPHFFPLSAPFLAVLLGLLVALVVLVQIGTLRYAYGELGISATTAFVLLALELLGSGLNIPVAWMRSQPMVTARRVVVFGVVYVVPQILRPRETLIAVNVGGALIPAGVSVWVLDHTGAWTSSLAAAAVVTVGVKLVARPVPGVGIVVPALLPAVLAAAAALVVASPHDAAAAAYVSGTAGSLIGADLLNLHRIRALGAPVASIGGAGTFDGIFITGIVAVVLVSVSR